MRLRQKSIYLQKLQNWVARFALLWAGPRDFIKHTMMDEGRHGMLWPMATMFDKSQRLFMAGGSHRVAGLS